MLYRHLGDKFFNALLRKEVVETDRLVVLENSLTEAVALHFKNIPEALGVELKVSQLWSKILVWQLGLNGMRLSTSSEHLCLQFRFPVVVASELVQICVGREKQTLEDLGIGLVRHGCSNYSAFSSWVTRPAACTAPECEITHEEK